MKIASSLVRSVQVYFRPTRSVLLRSILIFVATFISLINLSPILAAEIEEKPCVLVLYDRAEDQSYWMGKTYSIFLQNLLAHFAHLQVYEAAIEDYQSGDIESCRASFYLGSYFENKIPRAFFDDFASTKKQVGWLGYNIWMPGQDYFSKLFGYEYDSLTTLDEKILDTQGRPTFFKWAHYKGERFFKFGEFSRENKDQFLAGFEAIRLRPSQAPTKSLVLAELEHNGKAEKIPYVVQAENRFYVADIPFSYMHEDDRYLIFADLLFDILKEQPLHQEPLAFMRVEDVFPQISLPFVADILNAVNEEGVKAHISLVPLGVDPLQYYSVRRFLPIEEATTFKNLMQYYQSEGHEFIWHGVTHQYENQKNPHSGVSGDDFEFWDANQNAPVKKDSPRWVVDRLEEGLHSMRAAQMSFASWLTPHYQASALDYLIFGRVFEWNIGRVIYFDYRALGLPSFTANLLMNSADDQALNLRRQAFEDLSVETKGPWNGQFFPYLIFGDHYGQRLIPENLGNSQPYRTAHVIWPRSVSQMVETARRNRVLRDQWASFFYHPALLDTTINGGRGLFAGDAGELKYLIQQIKKLGYRFTQVSELNRQYPLNMRRPQTLPLRSSQ